MTKEEFGLPCGFDGKMAMTSSRRVAYGVTIGIFY